jgi:hypothetical protein
MNKTETCSDLRPNSTVVFCNTQYHNVKINKVPNSNSAKQDMRDWLQKEGIPVSYTEAYSL